MIQYLLQSFEVIWSSIYFLVSPSDGSASPFSPSFRPHPSNCLTLRCKLSPIRVTRLKMAFFLKKMLLSVAVGGGKFSHRRSKLRFLCSAFYMILCSIHFAMLGCCLYICCSVLQSYILCYALLCYAKLCNAICCGSANSAMTCMVGSDYAHWGGAIWVWHRLLGSTLGLDSWHGVPALTASILGSTLVIECIDYRHRLAAISNDLPSGSDRLSLIETGPFYPLLAMTDSDCLDFRRWMVYDPQMVNHCI